VGAPLLDRALRESQNTNTAPIALSVDDAVDFQRIGAFSARIMTTSSALSPDPAATEGRAGFGLAGV